jgi:hypothetical protein
MKHLIRSILIYASNSGNYVNWIAVHFILCVCVCVCVCVNKLCFHQRYLEQLDGFRMPGCKEHVKIVTQLDLRFSSLVIIHSVYFCLLSISTGQINLWQIYFYLHLPYEFVSLRLIGSDPWNYIPIYLIWLFWKVVLLVFKNFKLLTLVYDYKMLLMFIKF